VFLLRLQLGFCFLFFAFYDDIVAVVVASNVVAVAVPVATVARQTTEDGKRNLFADEPETVFLVL